MIRATVFNFVRHEVSRSVLPFAYEYNIIDCKNLEGNYSRLAPFKRQVNEWLEQMMATPGWSIMDRVYIIYPLEQDAQFAVSLLTFSLAGMNLQPVLWLEISEFRGLYLDLNEFYSMGLDKVMTLHSNQTRELSFIQ